MKLAVPDMVSNSYFPAEAAIELGVFRSLGLDVSLELIFPVDKAYEALREGKIDIVAGSAHSALAAFPRFEGVRLLCAQAQGMYWFLVMHADFKAQRGDLSALKGRKIGAAPWVEMGLRWLLQEAGVDIAREGIAIAPVPSQPGHSINFGLNAAKALENRQIDGFWANGMAAEIAVRGGFGTVVLDARRGDGPESAFDCTMASVAVTQELSQRKPDVAKKIIQAIGETHRLLKADVGKAADVGAALFPPAQAELITDLIRRDLPYYDTAITPSFVREMSRFCQAMGQLDRPFAYDEVVAPHLAQLISDG